MRQHHKEFDTRPLADGLHDLAGQAADAPGLFDAVAAGARRRSAGVRASGAVLAVGGVLGIAAGVAAWPSGSGPAPGADEAKLQSSVAMVATYRCPAESPGDTSRSRTGSGKPLLTGTPIVATLCVYELTDSGTAVRAERIMGSDLKVLIHDLDHAKSSESAICTEELRNPEHRLVLQYVDGSAQDLVIDMSGCGTVRSATKSVLLPAGLRQRITS